MHLKTFSNLYTFLAVYSARYVTSQVDKHDSHFLPLDIAKTCIIINVLFLWGSNLNEIIIDAGLDLVLESYPQHTPLLKWQSLVCVSRRVINGCFCGQHFVALSNGMHEIRDEIFVDLFVLLVYQLVWGKENFHLKQETSPMHIWSRFITIVGLYGSNRCDSHVILSID